MDTIGRIAVLIWVLALTYWPTGLLQNSTSAFTAVLLQEMSTILTLCIILKAKERYMNTSTAARSAAICAKESNALRETESQSKGGEGKRKTGWEKGYGGLKGGSPPKPNALPHPSQARPPSRTVQSPLDEEIIRKEVEKARKALARSKISSKEKTSNNSASSSSSEEEEYVPLSEYITPTVLSEPNCPPNLKKFNKLRSYDKKELVAPHFTVSALQAQDDLGIDDLLSQELVCWGKAYETLQNQDALGRLSSKPREIGTGNSVQNLQRKGKRNVLMSLKEGAPKLKPQVIKQLDRRTVKHFFNAARIYCLESSIPWKSFFYFSITKDTVGLDIWNQIQPPLEATGHLQTFAKRSSVFIENLINRLLPRQENYWVKFREIERKHLTHLTAANPSTEELRINLKRDAAELGFLHPYVKRLEKLPTDETDKIKVIAEAITSGLLFKIVQAMPGIYNRLIMVYISNPAFETIEDVPEITLINDLEQIFKTQRAQQMRAFISSTSPNLKEVDDSDEYEEEGKEEGEVDEGEEGNSDREEKEKNYFPALGEDVEKEEEDEEDVEEEEETVWQCPYCDISPQDAQIMMRHITYQHPAPTNLNKPPPNVEEEVDEVEEEEEEGEEDKEDEYDGGENDIEEQMSLLLQTIPPPTLCQCDCQCPCDWCNWHKSKIAYEIYEQRLRENRLYEEEGEGEDSYEEDEEEDEEVEDEEEEEAKDEEKEYWKCQYCAWHWSRNHKDTYAHIRKKHPRRHNALVLGIRWDETWDGPMATWDETK